MGFSSDTVNLLQLWDPRYRLPETVSSSMPLSQRGCHRLFPRHIRWCTQEAYSEGRTRLSNHPRRDTQRRTKEGLRPRPRHPPTVIHPYPTEPCSPTWAGDVLSAREAQEV